MVTRQFPSNFRTVGMTRGMTSGVTRDMASGVTRDMARVGLRVD